jgi:hypothetical protein
VERRDSVSRLRHGSLSVSLTSSKSDSEGRRRAYRWGQTDLSPVRAEVWAGAVRAYTTGGDGGQLVRVREGRARHGARGYSPQEPFDARMDQGAPQGDLPPQHGGSPMEKAQRKQTQIHPRRERVLHHPSKTALGSRHGAICQSSFEREQELERCPALAL